VSRLVYKLGGELPKFAASPLLQRLARRGALGQEDLNALGPKGVICRPPDLPRDDDVWLELEDLLPPMSTSLDHLLVSIHL
jgi:hypothetical protein